MNTLLANTLIAAAGIIRGTLASAFSYLNTLIKSGTQGAMQFHQEGIAFAREMGMNAKEAQAYTEVLTDRTEKLAMKYGVAAEQVKELQRNISVATSRQLMLNESQAEGFLQLNKLVGSSTVTKFTEEMMNGMGGQLDTVQGAVSKAYATAAKSGLNAQKVSEKIANNLNMANKLSFRTGIEGLTRMAMQAEKVGMSLSTVESVANNFMEIDDAIENSARLNMLGSNAAIFGGNPLDMAYEANYDPEALQKRITSVLGGLASFDSTKGIASMNGLNMNFARDIAKAIGMNPDEAVRVAKKQAEVGFKEQKFGAQFDKLGLNQEQRDFLINKSTVRDGQMFYTDIKGKEHNLGTEGITDEVLKEMMKYEGKSDRDIMEENARNLTSINEILTGIKTSITAMFAKFIEGMFPQFQGDLKKFGEVAKAKLLPVAQEFGKSAREIYNWIKDNKDTLKTIGSSIATIAKWMIKYWPLTLTVLAGKKVLGMVSNLGVGKKLGRSAARGAANGITNIASRLHQGSPHDWFSQSYQWSRNAGNPNRVGKIRAFGGALKDSWQGASKLAKGTALLGIGASVMEGLGAQGKYNDTVNEINNSNMSQAEKTKALEQARIDRNSEVGGAVGTGVGTVLGTFFFGPLGGMIGGAVGQFAGEFIGKYWDPIMNGLGKFFSGIGDAISNGFKWAIDTAKSIFSFDWAKNAWNGFTSIFSSGEKHAKGGVIGGSSYSGDKVPVLANSGEAVITPQQFNSVFGETPVKPKKSLGEAEYIYKPNRSQTSNVNGNTITVKDFNININGTLKLDAGTYSKNIDARDLLNNHAFMTEIKNKIMTSINEGINNGRYLSDLATTAGFSSPASVYGKR